MAGMFSKRIASVICLPDAVNPRWCGLIDPSLRPQVERFDDPVERDTGCLIQLTHAGRVARLEQAEAARLVGHEGAADIAHPLARCTESLAGSDRRPLY